VSVHAQKCSGKISERFFLSLPLTVGGAEHYVVALELIFGGNVYMQFNVTKTRVFLITLTALFFLLISPLSAQSQGSSQGQTEAQPGIQPGQENAPSFEETDLKKFVQVMQEIQTVQTESNEDIESAFSESPMSKQRFNTLYQARQGGQNGQNGQKAEDETEAETKQFNKLAKEIQTIQKESQEEMVETVRDNDMTVQKFNQIVKAMRSNPELGQRIQQMM